MSRGKKVDYFLQPGSLPEISGGILADIDANVVYTTIEAMLGTTGRSFWDSDAEYQTAYIRVVRSAGSLLMDGVDRLIRALWQMRSSSFNTALDPTDRGLYPTTQPVPSTIASITQAVQAFNTSETSIGNTEIARLNTIIGHIDQIEGLIGTNNAAAVIAAIVPILEQIDGRLFQSAGGVGEDTAISVLLGINQQTAFSQQRLATIEALLQTADFDTEIGTAPESIARIMARAMFNLPQGGTDPREGLARILIRQLGGNTTIKLQDMYQLLGPLLRFDTVADALDPALASVFGPSLLSKILLIRQDINSLIGQFATPDFPSPIRNRIEDISDQLGTLNTLATSSNAVAIQSRDLLQQLLDCSPCEGSAPLTPSACGAPTSGFVYSTGWTRFVDSVTGDVFYVASLTGSGSGNNLSWNVVRVNDALVGAGQQDAFQIINNNPGGGRSPFQFCMSWEGNSGQWGSVAAFPTISASPHQGTVEITSPAPANIAPTRQADQPSLSNRSRWYVVAYNPSVPDAPPPVGARVFIVPQIIA